MVAIVRSDEFDLWLSSLKDPTTRARIQVRIDRAAAGNLGDHKSIGNGISEMRIHFGPGFRLYFMQRNKELIILLCGGDKSSQQSDIASAKTIADRWEESK